MGARFRNFDDTSQTLLDGIVYSCSFSGVGTTYPIGFKAICERNPELPKPNFAEEDLEDYCKYLYELMGISLLKCHEIEWLLSKSFVFAVSEKQKKKYNTLGDFFAGWEKKTLGGLISAMQEAFEIDDDVINALYLFLDMRNQLIHGITQTERYSISNNWGQRELISFLDLFLKLCEPVKNIAESCFEVSIHIANNILIDNEDEKIPLKTRKSIIALFANCFKVKIPSCS